MTKKIGADKQAVTQAKSNHLPATAPKDIATSTTAPLVRLQDYAYAAIQKHVKKSLKHQPRILADTDPEEIHQMRVGLRRLRTALDIFQPAIALPATANTQRVKKLAQRLGTVRDLDVMQSWLMTYQEQTQASSNPAFATVLKRLKKTRQKRFHHLTQVLTGSKFERFQQAFQIWLDDPQFQAIAAFPIAHVLPDLLSPLISAVLLHPAWLVGTKTLTSGVHRPLARMSGERIHRTLQQHSAVIHDLRKLMKQVRYQTEFFAEFYGPEYAAQTQEFARIQELLGTLNDQAILAAFLTPALGSDWPKCLPELYQHFQHEQITVWQAWQPIQAQYLQSDFRDRLRDLIQHPQLQPAP